MKLSDIRKELPFETQTTSLHNVKRLATNAYGLVLDFDVFLPSKGKNLQRPLVWSLQQKQQLIYSVLKGIKIPDIAVIIDDINGTYNTYRIIDGKQRLSTLISFYKNEFAINWPTLKGDFYFKDLPEDIQRVISLLSIHAECAYEYSSTGEPIKDDDKIAWFERINFAGTSQDEEHLKELKNNYATKRK